MLLMTRALFIRIQVNVRISCIRSGASSNPFDEFRIPSKHFDGSINQNQCKYFSQQVFVDFNGNMTAEESADQETNSDNTNHFNIDRSTHFPGILVIGNECQDNNRQAK